VVVVDDGSTDQTGRLAREAGATVVRHPQNSGVGVAFQTMVRHALSQRADLLVTLDGDGQFNPADIVKLIAPIVAGDALVCTASRFRNAELVPTMPWVKKWGNRQVANLVNMLTGHRYADVSCGFRAYHREALLRLTVYHSFTYTHETFLDLAAKKVSIVEVPLVVRGQREFGKSKVASSVLRYGARTAKIMLLTYRDQAPLRLCAYLAGVLVLLGALLLSWSYVTFYQTGSWLKWAGFAGGATIGVAVLTLFFGFMADIATRLRRNQEEILYWLRRGVVDVPPPRLEVIAPRVVPDVVEQVEPPVARSPALLEKTH
jgi:glycosyltransferase involved in cell wall biosynthesis